MSLQRRPKLPARETFERTKLTSQRFAPLPAPAFAQQMVPKFKNEIAPDLSQPPAEQQQPQLEQDRLSLEEKIEKLEERVEGLCKLLARSNESGLHNKVNELQEELCQKRFDLHVAQIHLSAVRSQLQLFEYNYRPTNYGQLAGKQAQESLVGGQDCPSNSLAGSNSTRKPPSGAHQPIGYRNKWIKAFKSLKETPGPSGAAGGQSK